MKKYLFAIVAAMIAATPVLTSCGDDDDSNEQTTTQTPTYGQMVYIIKVTDDLLSLADLTVSYYDGDNNTKSQVISDTLTSIKIDGKLPLKTGFKVSGKKKNNVELSKDYYTFGVYLNKMTYTLYDQNYNVIEGLHSFSVDSSTGIAVSRDKVDYYFEKYEANGLRSSGFTINADGSYTKTGY